MPKGGQGAKHKQNTTKRSHTVQTLTFVPQKATESQRKFRKQPEPEIQPKGSGLI